MRIEKEEVRQFVRPVRVSAMMCDLCGEEALPHVGADQTHYAYAICPDDDKWWALVEKHALGAQARRCIDICPGCGPAALAAVLALREE